MRICLVSFSLEDYAFEYANALADHSRVSLYVSRERTVRHVPHVNPAVDLHRLDWPRLRSPRNLRFLRELLDSIRSCRPDVVHNLSASFFAFGWLARKLPDARVVTTLHDVTPHPGDTASARIPQWLVRAAAQRSDDLVVHGESLRDQAVRLLRFPADRVHVAPLGARHRYAEEARERPKAGENIRVLLFGRMLSYKGVEDFVESALEIGEQDDSVEFIAAGSGPEVSRLRNRATGANLEWREGFISDSEVARLFVEADIIALPYREASMSGVLSLAAAFGKPVVATRVGSLPEIVEPHEVGILIPPGEPKSLTRAVLTMSRDTALREKLGRNAQRLAETAWSKNAVAQRALEIYRSGLRTE